MRKFLLVVTGAGALAATGLPMPASADDLNSVVRTLNAVMYPADAQRLEEQARRNGRDDEERYWHNYGTGLEQQRRGGQYGETRPAPAYGGRIGPNDARALEEQARREGNWDGVRYWHNYAAGLEASRGGPPPGFREGYREGARQEVHYGDRIGPEQAYRLEEQARREGRWEEARYWAAYRAGLR
jgi:hypothetical protein